MFIRNFCYYGHKAFQLSLAKDFLTSEEDGVYQCLQQFYSSNPGPLHIMIAEDLENIAKDLAPIIHSQWGINPQIIIPKRGSRKKLVEDSSKIAKEHLTKSVPDHGAIFKEIIQTFDLSPTLDIKTIEVYDNSHLFGSHPYCGIIVVGKNGFLRKKYRKFNISERGKNDDDYYMMSLALRKRFTSKNAQPPPDLIFIDGGVGHLNIAAQTLKHLNLNIPLIAIAKGPERNAGNEVFYAAGKEPLKLQGNLKLLYFLQQIRDEAHNFVINAHRRKRDKAFKTSSLRGIPGIGPKRTKILLAYFGSPKDVAQASLEELAKVPGIGENNAEKILAHLKNQ